MKKIFSKEIFLLPVLFLTLFVSVNKVKAEAFDGLYISRYYDNYSYYDSLDTTIIDNLISYYNTNWSSTYSHYIIWASQLTSAMSTPEIIYLLPTNDLSVCGYHSSNGYNTTLINCSGQGIWTTYMYDTATSTYSLHNNTSLVTWNLLYSSDSPLVWEGGSNDYVLQMPSYSNLDLDVSYPQMNIADGETLPTYTSLSNTPSSGFTQVDMSQYEYIILSLRDYNTTTFNTTIYSLGRLCFTPVYDYGMKPKQDYFTGYRTQACTEYYNTSTPVGIYIIQADLDNHAVYYIKRYENETNILQIPTSIFDITYITSQNANNPQVSIGGRSYPSIPYSQLTDTANISTNEGYVSGQVCAIGDINCQTYESGMDISDLFTQPLKVLQSVWTSITSVFILIGEFIVLIPSPLREFLISSFMLAIILGILKIIL